MALSNRLVAEIRPGGSSSNGGLFDPSVAGAGVDRSQQNSPYLTIDNSLVTTSITANVITFTAGYTPTAADMGNAVHMLTGTNVSGGPYIITGQTPTTWTVAGAVNLPTSGTTTNATGRMGGAFLSINDLPSGLGAGMAWVQGSFSISSQIVPQAGSGDGLFWTYQGYTSVRGDNGRATFSTGSVLAPMVASANQIIFRNFTLNGTNTAQRAMDVGSLCQIENVLFENCLFNGCKAQNSGSKIRRCTATACGDGFDIGTGSILSESEAFLCNNGLRTSNAQGEFVECVSHNNVSHGMFVQGSNGPRMRNCTLDANTIDGIRINDTSGIMGMQVTNCEITNNAGWGIRSSSTDYSLAVSAPIADFFQNNAFFGNTLGNYFQVPQGAADIILTATPYTNAAGGDYSANGSAGGGLLLIGAGVPGGYGVLGTGTLGSTGHRDIGAVQTAGQSPATTATATMRSLWREATNERFSPSDPNSAVPDATVDIYLDYGLQALNREAHYHVSDAAINLVAGTQEYVLPADFVLAHWLQYANFRKLERSDVERWMSRGEDWRNDPVGEPKGWAVYSNKLILRPVPSAEAVAASPTLTLRYVSTPPSITTNGPEQLGSQEYRLVVLYGCLLWSTLYPESLVAQQRIAEIQKLWDASLPKVIQEYASRSISS